MDQSSVVHPERYDNPAEEDVEQEEENGSLQDDDNDDDGRIRHEERDNECFLGGCFMTARDSTGRKGDEKKIAVVYRYTHFTAASDTGTTAHRLRFVVPPAGDMARSLRWAGASLEALRVYPRRHRADLRHAWSVLLPQITPKISPGATSVEVLFHAFSLRDADNTAERRESLVALLEGGMEEEHWPGCKCHGNLEVHLPVPCGPESAALATEENCPVCWELLKGDDLATWPGCSKPHMFHGACFELILQKSDECPLCRNSCYVETESIVDCETVLEALLGLFLWACLILLSFKFMMYSLRLLI
jgi:hypothetical protein